MEKKPYEEEILNAFDFLIERGFSYSYTYDKGSDSSCVYIYRLSRGRDYFDFRAVSGGGEGVFVAFANGEYAFPNFKIRHKKEFRVFRRKHFFKKATVAEKWAFAGELLKKEAADGTLFGVRL